jgi:hypothetical protein
VEAVMFGELTLYGQRLPDNCRVGFSHHVHIREAAMNPDVEQYVQRVARTAIADTISKTRMARVERDFSIEFRCDLYVFSPDEFWGIVEQAAHELADRYPIAPKDGT